MAPRKKRVARVEKSTRTTRSRATKKSSDVTSDDVDNVPNDELEDALANKTLSSEVSIDSDTEECENVCDTVIEMKVEDVLSPDLQLQTAEVKDECQKSSETEVEIVDQLLNLKVQENVENNVDIEPMVIECEEVIEIENSLNIKEDLEVNTEILDLTNLNPPENTANSVEEAASSTSSTSENIKEDEGKEPENDQTLLKPSSIKPKTKKTSTPKSTKVKTNKIKKDALPKKTYKTKKKIKKVLEKTNSDTSESSITSLENLVRRSSRIKCISDLKQRGQGVVKSKNGKDVKKGVKGSCNESDSSENSNSGQTDSEKTSIDSPNFLSPSVGSESDSKPVKVKSRWRRSSELEMGTNRSGQNAVDVLKQSTIKDDKNDDEDMRNRLKQFVHLKENQYLTSRLSCKVAKKMVCDCNVAPEEVERGEMGCGEDCLNRLLMIECGQLCPVNDRCTNKRFQKSQFSPCEVFRTDKKGLGIRATANIPYGEFILEYIGEVIGPDEFEDRATEYSKGKNPHYYFMSLRADAVIDATQKGNISRFINHSCEPNAETQKWTVNGELRIGFFSTQTILAGEEITFDYQFQRYGKEAQKCYCEATNCRGWLGEQPDEDDDEEEEDEEEEEEEDDEEEAEKLEKEEKPVEVIKSEAEPVPTEIPVEIKEALPIEIKSVETKETEVVTSTEIPIKVEVKKPAKKEKRKVIKRKVLKDIFDDVDVDEAIEMLLSTGLKNQAHTLKLSRLMIRANEPSQRSILLRILRHGEFPCRRLFLDYHGLRLIHGWMNDVQQMVKNYGKREPLRLELLQTLATLPIPNKTMLQDSKVLLTVEKWSVKLEGAAAEIDSESNSPKLENEVEPTPVEQSIDVQEKQQQKEKDDKVVLNMSKNSEVEEDDELEIRKSVGMLANVLSISKWIIEGGGTKLAQDIITMFEDETEVLNDELREKEQKLKETKLAEKNYEIEIVALAVKLLEEWAGLKEVFRIPKKERIEQMKEHEREADRGYKAGLEHDSERKTSNRYRQLKRLKNDFDHSRKNVKADDRYSNAHPNINKHERRKLFAMQVQHQEIERKQRDMWRQHELQCIAMGTDPRLTAPFDPTTNYTCIWNQQTRQWQNVPLSINQNPIISPKISRFSPALPFPFPGGSGITNMPPPLLHNVPLPVSSMSQSTQNNPNFVHSQAFIPPPLTCPDMSQPPPNISQSPNMPHQSPIINMNHPPPNLALPLTNVSHPGTNPMSIPPPGIHPNMLNNQPSNSLMIQPMLPNNAQPTVTYQEKIAEKEDPSQVKFAGPIPPPVKLPPKWKCAKDKYNRPYYYHIRIRVPQWEPPEFPQLEIEEESSDSTSSSDTSSLSSDSSSEDSDEDDMSDTKLLMNIRKKVHQIESKSDFNFVVEDKTTIENSEISGSNLKVEMSESENSTKSLDERLLEEFNLSKKESHAKAQSIKRKRSGLVTEVHIISPRSEEDKLYAKENSKKYKENKERLKKQKEVTTDQVKKRVKVTVKSAKPPKKHRSSAKAKLKETMDLNSESAKKIKEAFRSNMAGVMVGILNPYRKPDCTEGKITNTEDFKHLARKLTHFVMLKELKHCQNIDDLTCTESVKLKAKEFVRKYMSKFGENYTRPKDDLEY